ncbi:hypothetical protein SPI_03761 [Niveomyces insectorum RCEF 264]|uniref:Uncharacterized protein n=1 Tax=Niveomyces insectorum RCEF 264 TaxID=1081102 RepID=A0A167WC24_9HYPO|nr:hypothetical protein SPI_03761 [Niveomyces insectorum RCEF 264]
MAIVTPLLFLIAYLASFVLGLLVNPPVEQWLPGIFQTGGRFETAGHFLACVLPVLLAPVLLVVLAFWTGIRYAWRALRPVRQQWWWWRCCCCCFYCCQESAGAAGGGYAQSDADSDLEAGCNCEDSLLSDSDLPPLYDDVAFSTEASVFTPPPSLLKTMAPALRR